MKQYELSEKDKQWIHEAWLKYKQTMNKQQVVSALHQISNENEMQPAGEHQTRVAVMLSELARKIETDGQFPQPCKWIDEMPLLVLHP